MYKRANHVYFPLGCPLSGRIVKPKNMRFALQMKARHNSTANRLGFWSRVKATCYLWSCVNVLIMCTSSRNRSWSKNDHKKPSVFFFQFPNVALATTVLLIAAGARRASVATHCEILNMRRCLEQPLMKNRNQLFRWELRKWCDPMVHAGWLIT